MSFNLKATGEEETAHKRNKTLKHYLTNKSVVVKFFAMKISCYKK